MRSHTRLLLRALVSVAVVGGPFVLATATPASATPTCVRAWTTGYFFPANVDSGNVCAPYPYEVNCEQVSAGVDPMKVVWVRVCYPQFPVPA